VLKNAVEKFLVLSGVPRVYRARMASRSLVLAYHNIVPRGEQVVGDRSLHLSQEEFAAQLDLLCDSLDVVPLEEAIRPGTEHGRPRAAITFDDAYRGALGAGLEELKRRNLPATYFVTPGFVGGGTFWWDALADETGLPERLRAHALTSLRGDDAAIRSWAKSEGLRENSLPAHQTVASEAELHDACTVAGIRLAGHTWSHPNLPALDADALEIELCRPLQWLRERFADPLPWISYPYGLSSPTVAHAARAAGYAGGLLVTGGWLSAHSDDRFALPRLNIPAGVSRDGFALRVSGLPFR
jgi:peptidoglycan/xylan/chitin deacetylase (PgdA/CDA1 family)